MGLESLLDAAAQRVHDDEWDQTHGDTEAFGGTDEGSHLMAQTAASDLRRGAFRCPSNGAQCLKECASRDECAATRCSTCGQRPDVHGCTPDHCGSQTAAREAWVSSGGSPEDFDGDTPVLCPASGDPCRHSCSFAPVTCPRSALMDSQRTLEAMAEPATELAPDIPVHRVFMPRVDPETGVPWCSSSDCPHYRRRGEDFPPLCSILDDLPTKICEPAVRAMAQVRTEPAPAEGWADGLALTPAVSYNGQPLPQVAWDLFEVYQSAEPAGLPGTLLLDDKPARFVRRRDGVAVEAIDDASWSLGSAREGEPLDSPEAEPTDDGPDVGRMLAQSHERGGREACAQVRSVMATKGVEQHDPESLTYEPERLPSLVTALWRLTEPGKPDPPRTDDPTKPGFWNDEVLYGGDPVLPSQWDLLETLQRVNPGGLVKSLTLNGEPARMARGSDGQAFVEASEQLSDGAANRADHEVLSEARAYKREMAGPNGGSGVGGAYVVSRKICSCQPIMARGGDVVGDASGVAACPIHGWAE